MLNTTVQKAGKALSRSACAALAAAILLGAAPAVRAEKLIDKYAILFEGETVSYRRQPSYAQTLEGWRADGWTEVPADTPAISLAVTDAAYGGEAPVPASFDGREGLVLSEDTQWAEWAFTVETPGLYSLQIEYYAADGTGLPIQRGIRIDGEAPFEEAGAISLSRRFVDTQDPRTNSVGDEVAPALQEVRSWITSDISDSQGIYTRPLLWKLDKGEHTLRLDFVDQPVTVRAIRFLAPAEPPAYQELAEEYDRAGYSEGGETIRFQAEERSHVLYRTQSSIVTYNNGDPMTEPEGVVHSCLNCIGGYSWRSGGQTIAYRFEVAEAGLYKIALRVQQAWGNGLDSCRQIRIDGEVPCLELLEYHFPFERQWYTETLSTEDGTPYLFYFDEGEHTLSLTVKLSSDVAQALQIVQDSNDQLSSIYRQILLITGAQPDPNYDYDLEKSIPQLLSTFQEVEDKLTKAGELVMRSSTRQPSAVSNLNMLRQQLAELRQDPDLVARRLGEISNSLTSLGDWINEMLSSPLGIDSIGLYPASATVPARTSSFFSRTWATLRNFAASFQKDYNAIGAFSEESSVRETIDVWVSRGKEWATILQELIDGDFTPSSGIGVRLNILPSNNLSGSVNAMLLAITSGNGPDVSMGVSPDLPVEYAIRGMSLDVSSMPGFEQAADQFHPDILIPFTYQGRVYGLPETMDFNVLMIRNDIFSGLNIPVPETWDQVYYQTLPVLYQNSMQMTAPSFDTLLYQAGGAYYTPDGLQTALNSPEAYEAFEQTISLFLDLGFPITANFYNRFRSGEMPIGIVNYSTYMQILTAAPELAGKWSLALVPGTQREDGTVDHTTTALTGQADMILSGTEHPDASWEFLRWWSSAEVQSHYGEQVEGRIGTSARWNSANLEAFRSLPWNREHLAVIEQSWEWATAVPNVLGGVLTARAVSNATNHALYDDYTPREALEEAIRAISEELIRKQELYGIRAEGR